MVIQPLLMGILRAKDADSRSFDGHQRNAWHVSYFLSPAFLPEVAFPSC